MIKSRTYTPQVGATSVTVTSITATSVTVIRVTVFSVTATSVTATSVTVSVTLLMFGYASERWTLSANELLCYCYTYSVRSQYRKGSKQCHSFISLIKLQNDT